MDCTAFSGRYFFHSRQLDRLSPKGYIIGKCLPINLGDWKMSESILFGRWSERGRVDFGAFDLFCPKANQLSAPWRWVFSDANTPVITRRRPRLSPMAIGWNRPKPAQAVLDKRQRRIDLFTRMFKTYALSYNLYYVKLYFLAFPPIIRFLRLLKNPSPRNLVLDSCARARWFTYKKITAYHADHNLSRASSPFINFELNIGKLSCSTRFDYFIIR